MVYLFDPRESVQGKMEFSKPLGRKMEFIFSSWRKKWNQFFKLFEEKNGMLFFKLFEEKNGMLFFKLFYCELVNPVEEIGAGLHLAFFLTADTGEKYPSREEK